jgi:hypothetical protein
VKVLLPVTPIPPLLTKRLLAKVDRPVTAKVPPTLTLLVKLAVLLTPIPVVKVCSAVQELALPKLSPTV